MIAKLFVRITKMFFLNRLLLLEKFNIFIVVKMHNLEKCKNNCNNWQVKS